ncbi:hypothetical protein BRO54_1123 [Geobacillus proteiniphilus]|uniref:Sporulation protein YpjB n=2 Tax=Geobacillus proteiniphilus TaxID=860353 RepID=A0A1Q5T4J6_9BACL|nr:hypothetical protein BRO54_1123 [Geobacillus proteiniphilus]
MMKRIGLAMLLSLAFLWPAPIGVAGQTNGWEQLDDISDEALQLAKNGRFVEAKEVLRYFSERFFALGAKERLKSADELRAVTVTHEQAVKAMTAPIPAEDKVAAITQFRLVVDAIHSTYQPLWTEMEPAVMGAFAAVEKAAQQGEQKAYAAALRQLLDRYTLIEPSVKIDVPPEIATKVDDDLEALQAAAFWQRGEGEQREQLADARHDLEALFAGVKKDEADPSLIWVMIFTGGVIVLTLTYVGWRKYKGEKEEKRARQPEE